ncbi:MAG TPA: lysophospholipid acyltransferase family protein [Acidimicrobiales bacterium]|jgi:1-acyl-sn-glycerol-3-phosphate acyltransferase
MTARSVLGRLRRFPLVAPPWPSSLPRPAPERRVGLDYDHEWSRRYPVRLARAVVVDNVTRPVARLLAPPTIRGVEHLRHVGAPAIFVANHTSHIDTPLLLSNLPVEFRHRTVVAAASDYFFDRTWKAALWSFLLPAIPIERTRVNRRSADMAAELIGQGWSLIIFPEGGRSPDGWGQTFRPGGAAYLALRTGRPVVPVHLRGARTVVPRRPRHDTPPGGSGTESAGGRRLVRAPVTLTFGAPMVPDDGEDARRFGVRLERAVEVLADESVSDWWQARRRAGAGRTPSHRGPDASPWRRAWELDRSASTVASPSDAPSWPKR